jgi:DNA-binding CsgD family transcriptional regulator
VAVSLLRSAEVALLGQGNLAAAYVLAEEALAFFRGLSYKRGVAEALFVLARVQARQGNYLAARNRYEDILTLAREGDDTGHIHVAYRVEQSRDRVGGPSEDDHQGNILLYVEGLAEVVAEQGAGAWAARLWGAAEARREAIHAPRPAVFRPEYERAIAAARTHVGEKPFTAAWAEGRAMTLEHAIAYAPESKDALPTDAKPPEANAEEASSFILSDALSSPPSPPLSPRRALKQQFGGLTSREREVARLVAQGKSNRAIADELIVGISTVEAHISHIFTKLGFSSRAQIAAWAVEKGLAKAPQEVEVTKQNTSHSR